MTGWFWIMGQLVNQTPMLTIPLWQVLLYVAIISIAAVFERYRFVLLTSYAFSCYWVLVENIKMLAANKVSIATVVLIVLFAFVGFAFAVYHMATAKY